MFTGQVHGIIPGFMVDLEWAHRGLTELEIVTDMTTRKERLRDTDAFITLPGGVGTLEEFVEYDFALPSVTDLLIVDTDVISLLDRLQLFSHPGLVKS